MGIAINPANHRVYMTNDTAVFASGAGGVRHTGTDLVVIDAARDAVVSMYPLPSQGNQVQSVAADPATGRIYLSERYGNVYVFQPAPGL